MKKFLVLLFVLFLLAACSSAEQAPTPVPTNTALPPTLTPIPPTDTPIPTDTPTPTDTPIPTATPTPFIPKATIKIASQSQLSVQYVDWGTEIMQGADFAIKQLNGPLMDLGYKVEFVPYDDQTDYSVAVDVAKQIIADPEVLCVVGPFSAAILKPVKEIYHQAGLAFISPSAEAPVVNERRYLEVNRLVGGRTGAGMAGAQFADAQGYSRVFIIRNDDEYSQASAYHFKNEASRMGIEVTGYMATESTEGFGKLIDRLMAANTDLVYFSTRNYGQAGNFFREARAAGYTGAFLNNETRANLLEYAGPLIIEGGGVYYITVDAPMIYYPDAADLSEDFETLYGYLPYNPFLALSYDAAGICMKAIEQASIAKGGDIPTRAEVANAIRSIKDYQGLTDIYNFNNYGDPYPAQYFILQIISPDPAEWDRNVIVNSFEIYLPE